MSEVERRAEEEYGEYTAVDGVRIEVDGGWFLVRASGTEPKVRVTAEGETADRGDEVYEDAVGLLEDSL